jgi:hypothetical protein
MWRRKRKRKWADQRWALADTRLAAAWVMLLATGFVWPVMVFVAFAVLVVGAVVAVVRYRLRERRFARNPPPFWVDEL